MEPNKWSARRVARRERFDQGSPTKLMAERNPTFATANLRSDRRRLTSGLSGVTDSSFDTLFDSRQYNDVLIQPTFRIGL